jgi:hypothetical protein
MRTVRTEKEYSSSVEDCVKYIKEILYKKLGEHVNTPKGEMILVELYANGNVACIPLKCKDYKKEIEEFHSISVGFAQ